MAGLLIVLAIIGIIQIGYKSVCLQIILAILSSLALDFFIHYRKTKKSIFPSSAFITGLIIALVLSPQTKWYICVFASIIAIFSKHIIRYKKNHIFNPANLGLLSVMLVFPVYPSWWGQSFCPLIIIMGLFISFKMKRLGLPLIFIFSFVILNGLFNRMSLLDSLSLVNIFFVFIMLIEPKTSPVYKKGITIYAVIVALFSAIFFKWFPQYDSSILALVIANIFNPILNKLN